MQQLRLRRAEVESQTDVYKFPLPVSRIGAWQPKALHTPVMHPAEAAFAEVQANLDRLGLLLTQDDPDRPRAA